MPVPTSKNHKPLRPKSRLNTEDTRSTLIRAAQKHFGANGYKAASVHEIARDAKLNVSLVNYHFGGKEGLFKACFKQAGLARLEIAERILVTEPSSIEEVRIRLGLFVDEMLIDSMRNPEIFAIIQRELTAEFDILGDVFRTTFFRTFKLLSAFFTKAKEKKILATWVDPNLSAVQLIGSIMHIIRSDEIRAKIFKKSIDDPNVRATTRDYLVKTTLEGIWNQGRK